MSSKCPTIWESVHYMIRPPDTRNTLPLRLLCRRHGVNACFMPPWDCYQHDAGSECCRQQIHPNDHPLIAQFEMTDSQSFIKASKAFESHCDAICLNLKPIVQLKEKIDSGAGCTNVAYSQSLIIIEQASNALRLPVFCHIPLIMAQLNELLQVLEKYQEVRCKCVILSNFNEKHDVTMNKDQLIEVFRKIRQATTLPVFIESAFSSLNDGNYILKQTGLNGLVVTDAIVYNPTFFCKEPENNFVWNVASEFLEICQHCSPLLPIKVLKSHLFMIWHHCVAEFPWLKKELGKASTLEEFSGLCDRLKAALLELQMSTSNTSKNPELSTPLWCCQNEPKKDSYRFSPLKPQLLTAQINLIEEEMQLQNLSSVEGANLSRKLLRQQERYNGILQTRKVKRKLNKQRKKRNLAALNEKGAFDLTKRQMKKVIHEKMSTAMATGPKVCIDLSFTNLMSQKELNKLSAQLGRLYGSNRALDQPTCLYFSGISKNDALYATCIQKNDGFERYQVTMTDKSYLEIFSKDEIIYLSPDSENVLSSLDKKKVYIIGGLVDETVLKNCSRARSEAEGVTTACLPIDRYLDQLEQGSYSKVLAVNQVFDIISTYYATNGNWTNALLAGVPRRKGYGLLKPPNMEISCTRNDEDATTSGPL